MSSGAVWVMVPQLKVSMRLTMSNCLAMPKSATCPGIKEDGFKQEICGTHT